MVKKKKKKKLRFFFLLGINLWKHFVFVWLEFGENKKVMGFLQFKSGKKKIENLPKLRLFV